MPAIKEGEDDDSVTTSAIPFTKALALTDAKIDPVDTPYITFFLSAMPKTLPYAALFPHVVDDIFRRSVQNAVVRHSLLSVSSIVIDFLLHRPLDRFEYQYFTSISLIRKSLAENTIDEALAIAVFLVCWIDVVRGKMDTTRKHLQGLRLILESISKTKKGMSGILMQIWWISIKFDWYSSMLLVESPIFPILPYAEDEVQRQWIGTAVGEATEWGFAMFTLENLMHKACHYAALIHTMRCDPELKVTTLLRKVDHVVGILETESRNWVNRPIIQKTAQQELTAHDIEPSFSHSPDVAQFLSYPPLRILNVFYANLLNYWRALQIYISFIGNPTIGPSNPSRLDHAIEICRTWVALGSNKTQSEAGIVWIMFLVGATFGGKRSPALGGWIKQRLKVMAKRLPIVKNGVELYGELFEIEGDFWNELVKRRGALLS